MTHLKEFIMEIKSSNTTLPNAAEAETIKKSADMQEREAIKVLESANEESQKAVAQKTGLGTNLNIAG